MPSNCARPSRGRLGSHRLNGNANRPQEFRIVVLRVCLAPFRSVNLRTFSRRAVAPTVGKGF